MTTYFANVKTSEELKKAYHSLAKVNHPDNGGNAEIFMAIKKEFEELFDSLKNIRKNKKGEIFTATGRWATKETASDFEKVVDALIRLFGITVELCGDWIWVDGETKPVKEELKTLGLHWSAKHKRWYYNPIETPYYARTNMSMNQIREAFGSEILKEKESATLRING